MYIGICRTIDMDSPFSASISEITLAEAIDATKDYMYAKGYLQDCQRDMLARVESIFQSNVLPFLGLIGLQCGDHDSRAPFWND